ncbi:VIN3-like protein 2 [Capsella rubella]|uniref:VIN3-like protein 2 n=1 Tax=Capsella rubella TaxID=81985 RepID=UPI000CD4BDD0|nr:VIN3-like protein 2 [Capsella rubella]
MKKQKLMDKHKHKVSLNQHNQLEYNQPDDLAEELHVFNRLRFKHIRYLATTTNLVSNRNNSDASLPITPFRSDEIKNRQARNEKAVNFNNGDHSANRGSESGLEHCVKVIRQLECSGHIDKNFRQKFLTWYSLRATSQEIRVVKIFIDTFIDDPMALAEQLTDTFEDRVSIKRSGNGGSGGASAVVPSGFCMKLWH